MRTMTALSLTLATLAGCGQPKQLYVDRAWVRLGAVPGNPAAAYFTIHGGPASATLINVTTDVAIKSEMHESMAAGGMTRMTPVREVPIAADALVPFQPGGRHVMLFDMNPGIKPGGTLTLTLSFADGTRILQDAGVIAAGDPAPK